MRTLSRVLIVAAVGGGAAACGSDVVRFSDNPFSNPFSGSQRFENRGAPATTGSLAPAPASSQSAPVGSVAAAPLAPPQVASAPLAAPAGMAPARSASVPSPAAAAPAPTTSSGGWTASGGSVVTLGQGENLKTLANRYGVPESALRSANNLSGTAQPAPGQKVVIPVFNAAGTSPAAAAPKASSAAPVAAAASGKAVAGQPAQTLQAQANQPQGTKPADPKSTAKQQVAAVEPAKADPKAAKTTAGAQPAVADVRVDPKSAKPDPKASAKPESKAEPQKTAAAAVAPAAAPAAPAPETTASVAPEKASSEFRWPARGRIINGFGNKSGQSSDGISIAVPEGTPVKAAEGGVVGYAGNELKGYGNLVLIRHDNGYVTVYAHNGELKVKRGETVKRGQVIATSGQTGNVSSPQLKFEIRKGQTPVDPLEYLSGN